MTEAEKSKDKTVQFASIITEAVGDLINGKDGEEPEISNEDLEQYTTEFFHALATVAPTFIYAKLVDENTNNLEFNHAANKMIFKFGKLHETTK